MSTETRNFTPRVEAAVEKLAQTRDELRVKMHLAKADAKDEWQVLEGRWNELQNRVQRVEEVAEEAAKDVWAGVEVLADEIGQGYDKIRRAF